MSNRPLRLCASCVAVAALCGYVIVSVTCTRYPNAAYASKRQAAWKQNNASGRNASYTEVVVIRTHSPKAGMLKRMQTGFDDVRTNYPSVYFLISIDTSGGFEDTVPLVQRHVPSAPLHSYNWSLVENVYPGLSSALLRQKRRWTSSGGRSRERGEDHRRRRRGGRRLRRQSPCCIFGVSGRSFHTEPSILAWRHAMSTGHVAIDAPVWYFEDDVFFC